MLKRIVLISFTAATVLLASITVSAFVNTPLVKAVEQAEDDSLGQDDRDHPLGGSYLLMHPENPSPGLEPLTEEEQALLNELEAREAEDEPLPDLRKRERGNQNNLKDGDGGGPLPPLHADPNPEATPQSFSNRVASVFASMYRFFAHYLMAVRQFWS